MIFILLFQKLLILTVINYKMTTNSIKSMTDDDYKKMNDVEDYENYNSSDENNGHDEEECDSSGHCYECCNLSKCTTKDTWARQGQYECDKGMYFPCTICEPQFKGIPQPI